jgi:hypothetical protein
MKLRELYTTIIIESVADVIKRLKTTYPDQVPFIDERANWIRKTFPKGAEWYMLIIGDQMSGEQEAENFLKQHYPQLLPILDAVAEHNSSFRTDLHQGNIMLRGNTPVITDPVATDAF